MTRLSLVLVLLMSRAFSALVPVPELTGHVVDLTGTLSAGEVQQLDEKLRAFDEEKGSQVAVLIVPTTAPEEIEQFSIRVTDKWKLGRKKVDDGALLLVAKDDRTMRIEVGYGLEGALTDLMSKRIISDIITPRFQAGDFYGGINAGVDAILKVIQGEALAPPPRHAFGSQGGPGHGGGLNTGFLVIAILVGLFLKSIFGRMVGGVLAGGFVGFFAAFVMGSAVLGVLLGILALFFFLFTGGGGMGGRGGWGGFGGGFGGGGFGNGDFGGGFSGGGGGFGGGGASGKW